MFEYRVEFIDLYGTIFEIEQIFNRYAKEGWKVLHIIPTNRQGDFDKVIFERIKEN